MKYYINIIFYGSFLFFTSCVSSSESADTPDPVVGPVIVNEVGPLWTYAPESSGIVLSDGFIYTHNDSGNPSVFYKVNPTDGTLVQSISITNYGNKDWEDITADNDFIYIGDFGNNDGIRTDLRVLKISKAQFINNTATTVSVTAEVIGFSYSEQMSFVSSNTHNFDCETIISKGDSLYLFTKDRGDNNTRVYKLSKTPGQYVLSSLASYEVNGLITGGDYNAQTNELVLIGYSILGHVNSFVYLFSNFTDDSFFSGDVAKKEIGNNTTNNWQTEGIAFGSTDGKTLYISCESTSFSKAKLYITDKTSLGL